METGKRGGVVLRVEGRLRFIPASVAVRVAPPPRLTPVPGAPPELLGVTLHDGVIVPVIAIGPARGEMVVCQHAGELLGLVGGEIVRTGAFDPASEQPERVLYEGQPATPLDVPAIYAGVQARARPARLGT